MSQGQLNSPVSFAGTLSHTPVYQQTMQLLRTNQHDSTGTRETSGERPANSQTQQVPKTFGMTMLQKQLSKPIESGNQMISVPLKLENLGGNIQLLAAKSRASGGHASLIPVVVSGDEIFQLQGGQGVQKNVLLLASAQPAQSESGSQNLNLTGLLSTSSKEERQPLQFSKRLTGFQEIPAVNNHGNVSNQTGIGSAHSVPNVKGAQTVTSPVYKSKLEKAMAQNLLMQNSARNSGSKTAITSSVSKISVSNSASAVPGHQVKAYLGNRGGKSVPLESALQNTFHTSDFTQNPSIKSSLKVSKVAEYYKNMIAGKGLHQTEKPVYFSQPVETIVEQAPVPQYSIVPDITNFHTNPKIMDVFNANEVNSGAGLTTNQELYSAIPSISTFSAEPEVVIREKTYEDHCLGKDILSVLWRMREDNLFCDAVLFAGSSQIRLHKIVLIGASPEIHRRVASKTVDKELKLVLPGDLLSETIQTFLYYLYNGLVKLTQFNVEQIYRLSSIFGMTQLSKHCYDFCKVAKMGHVIIGSPYQEAAKQIQKETSAPDILPVNVAVSQGVTETAVSTSTTLSSPVVSTQSNQQVKKEVRDEFETISTDIDWITNDPSQSNIPIRKRGRNRKVVQSNFSKTEETETESGRRADNEITDNFQDTNNLKTRSDETKDNKTAHPKKSEVNKSEYYQSLEYETVVGNENVENLDARNTNGNATVTEEKNKQVELIHDFVYQFDSLPDPLMSGKLDETELLKLKVIDEKMDKEPKGDRTPTVESVDKPVTRRFRARANISIVEAASQMKAKSNDVTSISTPKSRKRKATKKSPTSTNMSQTGSAIRRLLTTPGDSLKENEQTTEVSIPAEQITLNESFVESETTPVGTDIATNVLEYVKNRIDDRIKDNSLEEAVLEKSGKADVLVDDIEEQSLKYPSTPKKAKLRKSTLEQQELRDTVYMRPPPKKRTKEIREMMQNEEDGKQRREGAEENLKVPDETKLVAKELEKENTSKKAKHRRKRPRIKNDIVLAKVYEIEKLAQSVESEKIFRCTFCSVEFKFAKRAVTHLIGTHDVDLEDTTEYVSVEKKSEVGKDVLHECDICGFRPKESGTYYIHYHKYFRHQTPLPKGWQAYKCDLCSKEFFTKFQLREHKLIHFEDNPFVCEQCGSGFRSRTCLNSHVFHKHSSVRKHKCPECPKTFKTATQMKVHKRVHTGEKPFLCPSEHCTYRSTTRGNMKLHLTSKHKLNPKTVKSLMESLEASEVGSESHLYDSSNANEVRSQSLSRKTGDDAGAFEVLLPTDVDNTVAGNRSQYIQSQVEVVSQEDVMVSTYTETVADNNHSMLHARDYSIVNQGSAQNQDLEMVLSGDNNMLENQNIPRHVELLIQDAHRFMQHQENPSQNQYVQDFQQHTENEIQDMRNRLKEQTSLSQPFDPSSSSSTTGFGDNAQGLGSHRILDPHSKEARMMIREAFEGHGNRSLLKSAILHANQDRLDVGSRQLPDNSNIADSANLLNEAEKLVIDLQDGGNHHIPLNQEDEVVQRLRSQIQQLRESSEQYRDTNITPLFRNDPVPEILFQNIASQQQQTLEPAHFQTYHHSSGSPPAYNSSSHGLISEIESQSNVALTPVSHDQTHDQTHSLQALQRQGYTPVASQSAANQYGPDGTLYQGYYQEQYDIENY